MKKSITSEEANIKLIKINRGINKIGIVIGIIRLLLGLVMLIGLLYGVTTLLGLISKGTIDSIISSIKNHI